MPAIQCAIIRGGTSKGIYIERDQLPDDGARRDSVILDIFGSPDVRQIDGLGGADKLTSKLAVMGPPTRDDCDIDYLFGQDGTAAARKGEAMLVLLDLNLPDMTGIDILRRVKENKYLKATPVVVLTTTDDSQEIKRCYELGCNVYITKPVNYESFANAIRQLGLFFSVIQVPPAAP